MKGKIYLRTLSSFILVNLSIYIIFFDQNLHIPPSNNEPHVAVAIPSSLLMAYDKKKLPYRLIGSQNVGILVLSISSILLQSIPYFKRRWHQAHNHFYFGHQTNKEIFPIMKYWSASCLRSNGWTDYNNYQKLKGRDHKNRGIYQDFWRYQKTKGSYEEKDDSITSR